MALIGDFDREITATTREIDARAKADERVKVLCQIRGVGRYTAMLVIAEVGDVSRFPTARHLCAWAGLAPSVRSSDGKARLGHISRQGSPALRWALTEAAQKIPTGGGRCGRCSSESPSAAGATSPRSPWPARSSPSATTGSRRRDPLPHSPTHQRPRGTGRGRMTHASPHHTCAHDQGARCMLGRARSYVWPPLRDEQGRPRT